RDRLDRCVESRNRPAVLQWHCAQSLCAWWRLQPQGSRRCIRRLQARRWRQQIWSDRKSRESSGEGEKQSGAAACHERWNHSDLEAEDRDDGRDRKRERPRIDAAQSWCIEGERKQAYRINLAKHGVDREPDREIEHDTHHGSGDGGEGPVERLVAAQRLDERSAEEDPKEGGDE